MLELFWSCHNCGYQNGSTQYMNVVFYRNEEQKKLAEQSVAKAAKEKGIESKEVKTKILAATAFTYAEDYHQKYSLRRHRIVADELKAIYPDFVDFSNSSAAARLNAYLSGYGDREKLEAEIGKFGLSKSAQEYVLSTFRPSKPLGR